jgi:Tfp pilus assembly protein PilF
LKKELTQEEVDAVRQKRANQFVENCLMDSAKLIDSNEVEKAHEVVRAAIRLKPEDPRSAYILGHCHLKAQRPESAYYMYRYCQRFKDYEGPHVWNALGHVCAEMQLWDESEKWYNKSLIKNPDSHTYSSLASIYTKKGNPQKAVDMADKALEMDPDSNEARWNAALALLKLKAWKRGWAWYDALMGTKLRPMPPSEVGLAGEKIKLERWQGEGGNVLIQGEQGLGDEIMFASILPDAIEKADKVVLAVDPRLINLFQRSFPETAVISRRAKEFVLPYKIDLTHSINMGSLGQFFRLKDEDFPGTPFLKPDPERCVMYRALLDSLGDGKKVGFMWRGGIGGLDSSERQIALIDAEPFLATEGIEWVSLNHLENAKAECKKFYDQTGIEIHHWDHIVRSDDYDDTAALVKELDAVVCITGTVGHMAASVGTPTFVFTPKEPQWRYGREGDKIPWYDSMTLFRQGIDWPYDEVLEALNGLG